MSRLEIIVVLVCLGLIAAVCIPLIYSTRLASRRQTCLHRVAELTRAALAEAQLADRMPPLENGRVGWPALLLVQLRLPVVAERVQAGDLDGAARDSLAVFTCPFDTDSSNEPGGLSYVGNSGYGLFDADPQTMTISGRGVHTSAIDLDGDGEVSPTEDQINFATGVFWPPRDAGLPMTLEFIRDNDGLGQTMLISENLDAGTWTSRETLEIAFVIGRDALALVDNPAGPEALRLPDELDLGLFRPHANPARPAGQSPVPSSLHAELIHIGLCDGSARPTSIHIDPRVYARLMTSAGTRYGQGDAVDAR
jgi:type II secretory pathway pseudopilin PulG